MVFPPVQLAISSSWEGLFWRKADGGCWWMAVGSAEIWRGSAAGARLKFFSVLRFSRATGRFGTSRRVRCIAEDIPHRLVQFWPILDHVTQSYGHFPEFAEGFSVHCCTFFTPKRGPLFWLPSVSKTCTFEVKRTKGLFYTAKADGFWC